MLDFISLTLIEMALTKDLTPGMIRTPDDDLARLVRDLAPGVLPPEGEAPLG